MLKFKAPPNFNPFVMINDDWDTVVDNYNLDEEVKRPEM